MDYKEAKNIIQGKLDCMKKCDVFNCKDSDDCENCNFCYAQGTFGEQKKAFELAIVALNALSNREVKHYAVCPIYILTWRFNCANSSKTRHIITKSYDIDKFKLSSYKFERDYVLEIYTGNWVLVSRLTEKGWVDCAQI